MAQFNPFLFYSNKLQKLFVKASQQKNPALWLHENDARTILFMLEALTRIHNKAFNDKLFYKWNKRFKKLEDVFGEIDQYITLENEFKTNKKVSKEVLKYFRVNANNFTEKCNQRLIAKDWLNNKLNSFDHKISEFNIEYNKEYLDKLRFTIRKEIDAIFSFLEKSKFQFTKIEEEVHELRRKLRWFSIYAQALNGLIQLKKTQTKIKFQINYFTEDVLNSPYNILPKRPKNISVIEFNHDAFFALSWMILKLEDLKDKGLKIQKLSDAIFIPEDITRQQAEEKAISILGFESDIQKNILQQSSDLVSVFVLKDKVLNSLIIS